MTVTALLAARAVPATDTTIDAAPGDKGERTVPNVEILAVGVAVVAKKPEG